MADVYSAQQIARFSELGFSAATIRWAMLTGKLRTLDPERSVCDRRQLANFLFSIGFDPAFVLPADSEGDTEGNREGDPVSGRE